MFARDEGPYSGQEDTKNLYGVHPFYMMIEQDNKAHGVLILNSNAQVCSFVLFAGCAMFSVKAKAENFTKMRSEALLRKLN